MNSSMPRTADRIVDVRFEEDRLVVDFLDSRTLAVPLALFPVPLHATPVARANWEISAMGLLEGRPSVQRRTLVA